MLFLLGFDFLGIFGGRFLLLGGLLPAVEVDYALAVERLDEHECDGHHEHAYHAEELQADIHARKGEYRGHVDVHCNEPRLEYLTDDRDYAVDDQQAYAEACLTREEADHCPRYHHRACAEYGQDIDKGCAYRYDEDISARVYADELQYIKPYRDLAEGDEHYGEVGFAHFAEDIYEQVLRPDEGVLVLLGDIALYHRGEIIVIAGDEEAGDEADERRSKSGGYLLRRGEQAAERGFEHREVYAREAAGETLLDVGVLLGGEQELIGEVTDCVGYRFLYGIGQEADRIIDPRLRRADKVREVLELMHYIIGKAFEFNAYPIADEHEQAGEDGEDEYDRDKADYALLYLGLFIYLAYRLLQEHCDRKGEDKRRDYPECVFQKQIIRSYQQ